MKIGVLCNGRHTGTKDWEGVVWGRNGKMGQIPKAIQTVLLHQEVVALVFGTGASERDGILEAHVLINYMFDNLSRLTEFSAFNNLATNDLVSLRILLEKITVAETTSKNTVQEFEAAMTIFNKKAVDLVIDVTSATHAPRCMRDVIGACEKLGANAPKYGVMVVPAETHYADAFTNDIGILEPAHRGDTPESFVRFHRAMMDVVSLFMRNPDKREGLLERLKSALYF